MFVFVFHEFVFVFHEFVFVFHLAPLKVFKSQRGYHLDTLFTKDWSMGSTLLKSMDFIKNQRFPDHAF